MSSDEAEPSLRQRIRHQETLATLMTLALGRAAVPELIERTTRIMAEALQAGFCRVLEHLPAENRSVVRARAGWQEESADPGPVADNGVRSATIAIPQGDRLPFGVLEAGIGPEGGFSEQDIALLQGAAEVLAAAIERQRRERQLEAAVGHYRMLLQEIIHRAKNNLQLVSSMLMMQAKAAGDAQLSEHLSDAWARVSAIGRLYECLSGEAGMETVDLGSYLGQICGDLDSSLFRCDVRFEAPERVVLAAERAMYLAMIVNEFVTNAAKHAYPDNAKGDIRVAVRREPDAVVVTVRDDGIGLPDGSDAANSGGLGMQITTTLATQLGATLMSHVRSPGAEFSVLVPLNAGNPSQRLD